MPLENAVFKPKNAALPAESAHVAEADAEEDFDESGNAELANAVPPLWDRVPSPPQEPADPVAVMPGVRRPVAERRTDEAVNTSGTPSVTATDSQPRDEVRERLATVVENRSRRENYQRSSNSIFGLDSPPADKEPERIPASSSISGPSFLGLDSGPSNTDYLLDDEKSGHGRAWLVALAIIVLAVLVGLQWRTEVQNQARRMASVVRARLQQPNAQPKVSNDDAAPASADAKTPATESSTRPPAPAPQPESAKTIGGDQTPVKDAAPEQPVAAADTASAKPHNEDEAAKQDTAKSDTAKTEAAKTERAAIAKEAPAPATKQTPAPEEQPPSQAGKRSAAENRSPRRFSSASTPAEAARPPAVDDSMLAMAQKYLQGQGVPRSCDRGMTYLREAVRQPSPRARSQMGALYATGTCVPQNRVEAYRWFTSALDLDPRNPWLARERDILYSEMTSTERQRVSP
ncbi:MAG: hypothetical protein JOY79_04745 [Acidobacteriaceae bacterium]|nr:hypothetical protein [Acidobacteriaceae bacterium]